MATNLKQRAAKVVVGSGAPANGDELSLSWIKFKIGTFYIDDANNKIYSRTARNKVAADWDLLSGGGSGGGVESVTSYDNNADALAALGAGKLYKSTTFINGSPIILLTV